jgi:hypothetical protein
VFWREVVYSQASEASRSGAKVSDTCLRHPQRSTDNRASAPTSARIVAPPARARELALLCARMRPLREVAYRQICGRAPLTAIRHPDYAPLEMPNCCSSADATSTAIRFGSVLRARAEAAQAECRSSAGTKGSSRTGRPVRARKRCDETLSMSAVMKAVRAQRYGRYSAIQSYSAGPSSPGSRAPLCLSNALTGSRLSVLWLRDVPSAI